MCGRFDLHARPDTVARSIGATATEPGLASAQGYNITPGRSILTVYAGPAPDTPALGLAGWGFRPQWAGDDAPAPINARAETVATSRYFRDAFARRRCLIPANGWFEWQQTSTGKQPWYVTATDTPLIFYAGLWADSDQAPGRCCAIITEPARGVAETIHPRMPLVLAPEAAATWLDPSLTTRKAIRRAVHRLDPDRLSAWPVSTRVNRPGEDDATLLDPVEG
ncbi:SOS response-associated peptidase [Spiribacter vilamensis]|uniref:Abasic site processing protein n=1 Tax=Spiribacter vilamensis TaxID=531306 RepID=A0A4Q8D204_9GAMM|nr:SOS response-associated peptidase [Spiribacter vilamensis]RZU99373.1 putative SOS response-associated peptidase YedK [Spiribacter vilamensis]TVO61647.1 SOS response-associated peptidase [Spiribacter vilamensis]